MLHSQFVLTRKRRKAIRITRAAVLGLAAASLYAQAPIEIASPTRGTRFRPGETVTITVRTTRKYEHVGIMSADPLADFQMLDAEPYRFSLPLPPDLDAGLYDIIAVGAPGSPGSVGFDHSETVDIDVEPVWSSGADGSRLVRDAPGVAVDTDGIPLRHRSAVSYPRELRTQGMEGTVVVEITPDWEGRVESVRVLSGPVELAKHVIESVQSWHYAARVGRTKRRRVSITFSIADSQRPISLGDEGARLVDNVPGGFWTSPDRPRRLRLKKLVVLGLSEDETSKLMKRYGDADYREGEVLPVDKVMLLGGFATMFDRDVNTYLLLDGSDVSATVAPVGFTLGDSGESPAIKTDSVPPGVDPERIRVAAPEQARRLISKVAPVYPALAKASHVQGIVRVHIIIGKDGRVLSATASGPVLLQRAAQEAVEQWTYSPTVVNGYAVEVITEANVEFFLPH
jgi:protein TonB